MFKRIIFSILFAFIMLPHVAQASNFPSRPIKIICPWGAGGEADLSTRIIAEGMSKVLGVNIVVQNIVGATAITASNALLAADPDGYTLINYPSAPLAIFPHAREIPYTLDSFDYIARFVTMPYFVVVGGQTPWHTLEEMIEDTKANPDKYLYSTAGMASICHIASLKFFKATGISLKPVNLGTDADAAHAMAANRIQFYAVADTFAQQNDTRSLASFSTERLAQFPDIPTLTELGYPVTMEQFMVLVGPKGMPPEVVAKLNNAVEQALKDPEVIEKFTKLAMTPAFLSPEETENYVKTIAAANEVSVKGALGK